MDRYIAGHQSKSYGPYYDHEVHELPEGQAWTVHGRDRWAEDMCSCTAGISISSSQCCTTCWHSACYGDCDNCSYCQDLVDATRIYMQVVEDLEKSLTGKGSLDGTVDPARKVQLQKEMRRLRQSDRNVYYGTTNLKEALDAVSKLCEDGGDDDLRTAVETLRAVLGQGSTA
jgi:hypothetical protein